MSQILFMQHVAKNDESNAEPHLIFFLDCILLVGGREGSCPPPPPPPPPHVPDGSYLTVPQCKRHTLGTHTVVLGQLLRVHTQVAKFNTP